MFPLVVAEPLWIFGNLIGLWFFWRLWRSGDRSEKSFWYAAAILITLWTTPHAILYDLSLLLIPAILLWQVRSTWHNTLLELYIVGWIAYMFSTPLTAGQIAILPIAIQISVIFFVWAVIRLYRLEVSEERDQSLTNQ